MTGSVISKTLLEITSPTINEKDESNAQNEEAFENDSALHTFSAFILIFSNDKKIEMSNS